MSTDTPRVEVRRSHKLWRVHVPGRRRAKAREANLALAKLAAERIAGGQLWWQRAGADHWRGHAFTPLQAERIRTIYEDAREPAPAMVVADSIPTESDAARAAHL